MDEINIRSKIKTSWWSIYFAGIAKFTIILIIVPAVYYAFFPGKIVLVTVFCSYPIIFSLVHFTIKNGFRNLDGIVFVKLFLLFYFIVLVRGLVDMETTQDYKVLLQSGLIVPLFLPLSVQFASYKNTIIVFVKSFLTFGLLLSCVLFFMPLNSGPFGFNATVSPLLFILLLSPYLNKKYKPMIYFLVGISFFYDFSNRANMLNIMFTILLIFTYYFDNKRSLLLILKTLTVTLLVSPIVFFILGVTGIFNVFTIGKLLPEYSLRVKKNNTTQDLFVDSRTSIYIDVFTQLVQDDRLLIGLGGVGKTKTSLAEIKESNFDKIYKEGRRGTESGMLSLIQTGGLFGGLVYYLLFIIGAFYAVFKSKNWLSILFGVWVSYKCFFSFIEDPLTFNISSLFLFFTIGICLNRNFRNMTDNEIKELFNFKILRLN